MNKARIKFLRSILKKALACRSNAQEAVIFAERHDSFAAAIRATDPMERVYRCKWLVRAIVMHEWMKKTGRRVFNHDVWAAARNRIDRRHDRRSQTAYRKVYNAVKRPTRATERRAYAASHAVHEAAWYTDALRLVKPYDKKFATKAK